MTFNQTKFDFLVMQNANTEILKENNFLKEEEELKVKQDGAEPVSEPKTIKSNLKLKHTFKPEALKGINNEPPSVYAKVKNRASTSNSAQADNLKNVKFNDDLPFATLVTKERKDLKSQIYKGQSSGSRTNYNQQVPQNTLQTFKTRCELCGLYNHITEKCYKVIFCLKCKRTDHRTCDHVEYMSTINMSQHLKSLRKSTTKLKVPRPSKRFFPPCTHCGHIDHLSYDWLYYSICEICGSYDHDTHSHNRIISLEKEINP
ncbi:hypothetical protein Tco_1132482 [Tanacetum coccineum]|uniref:Uncharacterized protein n=1 Tax=Tanacetum coccineum TaxID=301880 RepID=A0ABQ5JD52_9ASTR